MENLPQEFDTKNAKIMLGVFGVLSLIFVCGGAAVTGVAGSGSESDGVTAAMGAIGPACCAMSGLLMSGISMFAFKTNKMVQIVAPIVTGIAGGFFGGAGIVVFFNVIWPLL